MAADFKKQDEQDVFRGDAADTTTIIVDDSYRRGSATGSAHSAGLQSRLSSALVPPSRAYGYDEMSQLVAANNLSRQPDDPIIAIAWTESSFDPAAHASGSSATGLMMMTRGAAHDVGYPYWTLRDPATNIRAASSCLQLRIDHAGGDIQAGLSGYGTGAAYAQHAIRAAHDLESPITNWNPLRVLQRDIHP